MNTRKTVGIVCLLPFLMAGCQKSASVSKKSDSASSTSASTSQDSSAVSSSSASTEEDKSVDVVIMAGQSNCQGHSALSYLLKGTTEDQRAFYKNGFPNTLIRFYCNENDTTINQDSSFVPVKKGMGYTTDYFGLELGFAEALQSSGRTRKTFVIKYAKGGTSLALDWHSTSSRSQASPLYLAFIAYIKTALDDLETQGYLPFVRAFLWMQGETDGSSNQYGDYYDLESALVKDVRQELVSYQPAEGIPFVDGLIYANAAAASHYAEINAAKQKVAGDDPSKNYLVDTTGLDWSKEPEANPDIYHFDALSELELGKRFAQVLLDKQII